MDKTEFFKMFAVLTAAYPSVSVQPPTIEVYFKLLGDVDPSLLERAVLRCIRECKFFPNVAEIRNAATDILVEELGLSRSWAKTFIPEGTNGIEQAEDVKQLEKPQ
jgi:hypothetical protein